MTEINDNNEELQLGGESKFTSMILTLVAVLLTFAGPTYGVWVLTEVIGSVGAIVVGFGLFVVGLVMLVYLMRKKVIT
ncbi:MAG TPA: hypothetical protein VLH35_06905 [Candidatus Acidoferrales bacterium]|nr:hypothetical protein [Candidatus Acidoferrales bacterium]